MKQVIIAAALLATLAGAHAQNIVVDGGFESVAQAGNSWSTYDSIPGWTTTSGPGIEVRNDVAGTAFEGHNYVELDSTANSTMAQSLTTVAGSLYTLSFEYSARAGLDAGTNPVSVYWNGTLLGTAALDGTGHTDNVWSLYSYTVTGTGHDVIAFAAGGISDSVGGSLDAVSVSVVPEPSTVAMMCAGLGLIGFSLRKRRGGR